MNNKPTNNFGTRLGLILATAGSAVGLGNIWRFPTTAGENGGAAFILFYLLCTLLLGLPGMLSEFVVGRNGGANSFDAYAKAGRSKAWGVLGIMGMVCTMIILGFYSVVAGWCIYYFCISLGDNVLGDKDHIAQTFATLVSHPWLPSVIGVGFVLMTHSIVVRGVQRGIERASKIMMPLLFVMLLVLIIASCSLPGAWAGLEFLFKPDFSKLTPTVMFEAIGQSFFSLSLGAACLCTYASYFKREVNMVASATQIVALDVAVAIMAGLMIFPATFSVGLRPDAGPSLIFQTLPYVFNEAFPHAVAYPISVLFFFLLTLAALTSTISMHEIGTALLTEKLHTTRNRAAWIETGVCCIIGILSALSLGPVPMGFFGQSLFDNFDNLTSCLLMPVGALLTSILVGWLMPSRVVYTELRSYGKVPFSPTAYRVFLFLIRFITPLGLVIIFLYKWGIIG